MVAIGLARGLLQQRTSLSQDVKQRSERLHELAKYRNGDDTVPVAESLASAQGGSKALADDMWEIYRALLR